METEKDQYGHPRMPYRGYYDVSRCNERRKWVEQFSKCTLERVGEWWDDEGKDDSVSCLKLKGNVENPIGLAKVPIGIVGPLMIRGNHVNGYLLCPFATTEGALVASATRGAALLTRSGGVITRVLEQVMIRSPAFYTDSIDDVENLYSWMVDNMAALQKQIRLFSQYAVLVEIKADRFGCVLIASFKYRTGDAAGQNMVTTATWHACKWLIQAVQKEIPSLKIKKFIIESLASGDKRIAFGNLSTRGVHAMAEAWIPKSVLENTLKVTVDDMLSTYRLFQHGTVRIGSIGFNVNVVNAIAAIFTATGQDIACVAESGTAQLILEPASVEDISKHRQKGSVTGSVNGDHPTEDGLYAAIVLPSLIIGTVGGGTSLGTQKECLQLLGCYGTGYVNRFGEIIAGFALGLDLSTLGAIANGTFAFSHEKLGRNRPENGFRDNHINDAFFSEVIKGLGTLIKWQPFYVNTGNSIISELTKSEMSKKVGHFGYNIDYQDGNGKTHQLAAVVKSKPLDLETCNMVNKMGQNCGFTLAVNHEKHKTETGFRYCHIREVGLAALNDSVLRQLTPKIYYTIQNVKKDIFVIVMEYLTKDICTHLNTADDISGWSIIDIKVVLRDLAKLHACFYAKQEWLYTTPWLEEVGMETMMSLQPLWVALLGHASSEFPEIWSKRKVQFMEMAIEKIPHFWASYESAPKTLIHCDCNPRNLCLRKSSISTLDLTTTTVTDIPFSDPRTMCLYDWELARIDIPQRDVVEFLAFILPVATSLSLRLELIEFYRIHFEHFAGISYPMKRFIEDYKIACLEFSMNRLLLYTMAHTYKDYYFLSRVVESHFAYMLPQMESEMILRSRL